LASHRVSCDSWDELTLEIDPSQVEGALVNLSFNAVDATPDGGRIAFRSKIDGSVLSIEVENSGSAITDAHMLRIFEPFFTTKPNGTGLGLAIAKGVACSHGGDLWVSKNQNGAVAFTMTLLIRANQYENEEAAHGQSADSR
jgi:two-component system sensor histidine kinase FlrB